MNAVLEKPATPAKTKASVKAPKSLAPPSANAADLSVPREAINRAGFRIQSALDTLELGIEANGEDELRGVRILVEDMVNRFGDAADLPDLGGPSGIAWDISCALSIVLPTVKRLNEGNMDDSVLYAVTYLLESAKELVDHACDNWPIGAALQAERKPADGIRP